MEKWKRIEQFGRVSIESERGGTCISYIPALMNKWIPCSEQLPEEDGIYLVTDLWEGYKSVDTANFNVVKMAKEDLNKEIK